MIEEVSPKSKSRKKFLYIFFSGLIIASLILYLLWDIFLRNFEWTNDAYVEGNKVVITPLIEGFVQAIHTDDTFLVRKGQLIVELDKTDATISLEKSKESFALSVRKICQSFHSVFVQKAKIDTMRAMLIQAIEDYQHRYNVIKDEGVSIEDFEHAIAALRASFYDLKSQIALFNQYLAFVQDTTLFDHPEVQYSMQKLKYDFVNLYRCNIYSPVDGLVAQRQIQVGMRIHSGYSMMSVIPLDQIWVNANYKETQMARMRIGQKVKITADLYGDDVIFDGIIVGLPGAAGNAFSLLPPQNLSGNWIKIVQRLPVRVSLDPNQLLEHPLRLGLSLESTVDITDQLGLYVPINSEGSPNYVTNIFSKEEEGVDELIEALFKNNIDPLLVNFITNPLKLQEEKVEPDLENLINCLRP
jgi:membrane fusion protein (multidrug efflux system)